MFSIRLPLNTIKYALGVLGCCLFFVCGVFLSYVVWAHTLHIEKTDLMALRDINAELHLADTKKQTQIEEMAKELAVLQKDLQDLKFLDNEIRTILASSDKKISLSGAERPPSLYIGNLGGPEVEATANDVENLIKDLKNQSANQRENLIYLKGAVTAKKAAEIATPSIWPAQGEVTSPFGWRSSPWGRGGDWHPGIDIANSPGTPVLATAAGVVVYSSYMSGYGNLVLIDHGNGIETAYGHNAQNLVKNGQAVQKGERIAFMGSTGASTGPHVHYEVRINGTAVNPSGYL